MKINIKITCDNIETDFNCRLDNLSYNILVGNLAQLKYTLNQKKCDCIEKRELCNYYVKKIGKSLGCHNIILENDNVQ